MAIVYYVASTLDGFIADENDGVDWLECLDAPDPAGYEAFDASVGALVMGAETYRFVLRHIEAGGDWPYQKPTFVLSHSELPGVAGGDVRFQSGEVKALVSAWRTAANGKDVWIVGGGALAAQVVQAGLLDSLIVNIASRTLGRGKPILPIDFDGLQLQEAKVWNRHFVELHYAVKYNKS